MENVARNTDNGRKPLINETDVEGHVLQATQAGIPPESGRYSPF